MPGQNFSKNLVSATNAKKTPNIGRTMKKCKFCEHSSLHIHNIRQHVKIVHDKLLFHKCSHCHFSSDSKFNAEEHVKAIHLKIRDLFCVECDFSTSFKSE